MMGIAIKRESQIGVSEVNESVNIMDFFQSYVLPELEDANHGQRPVLKATAVKFVCTFRCQFSKEAIVQLLPLLVQQMNSPVIVVHTFAAYAVERILASRTPKLTAVDIKGVVSPLFTALFSIIEHESNNENDYAMKCVMRSLAVADSEIMPVVEVVMTKLRAVLERAAKNPRNPHFNHFLFESFAVLIRSVCSKEPSATSSFEGFLFDPFNVILQADIAEFTPYVFQLLAQLLEFHPTEAGLGAAFSSLFAPLLSPVVWEKRGNIPALSRLMRAYIKQAPTEIADKINPILGVFQKLVSLKATEASGFEILDAAVLYIPYEVMQPRMSTIFQILLTRLQKARTTKYTRHLAQFFALYVTKYDVKSFMDCLNSIQTDLGTNLLVQVWIPHLCTDTPTQRLEAKIQVLGLSKVLFESPSMLADPVRRQLWIQGLICLINIITSPSLKAVARSAADDDEELDLAVDAATEYDAQFSQLHYARRVAEDPFASMDPINLFLGSLQSLSMSHPGQLTPLIQEGLREQPKVAANLESLLNTTNISLA
jgi:exportin-2 (importin alpha re-exporter)